MVRSLPGGTISLTAPYLGILWGMFVKARLHRIWVQKYALNHRFGPQPDELYPLLKGPLLMTLRTESRMVTVGRSELGGCVLSKMPVEVQDLLNYAKVWLLLVAVFCTSSGSLPYAWVSEPSKC